jgi:hypothetical protein
MIFTGCCSSEFCLFFFCLLSSHVVRMPYTSLYCNSITAAMPLNLVYVTSWYKLCLGEMGLSSFSG